MRGKRLSLSSEIMGIQTSKRTAQKLDYEKIVNKQQEVIKLLQKQITYLRQYVFYVADYEEIQKNTPAEESDQDSKVSQKQLMNQSTSSSEPTSKKINGLKGLIAEVMKIVQANNPDEVMGKLKEMQVLANRKIEPVFIEKIKEKQVPITVEKEVIVEKIIEKVVEKIVEVPVFREKIVEKFIDRPADDSFRSTNSSHDYSREQNGHGMKKKENYYEPRPTVGSPRFNVNSPRSNQVNSPRGSQVNSPRGSQVNSPRWREKNGGFNEHNTYVNKSTKYVSKN